MENSAYAAEMDNNVSISKANLQLHFARQREQLMVGEPAFSRQPVLNANANYAIPQPIHYTRSGWIVVNSGNNCLKTKAYIPNVG